MIKPAQKTYNIHDAKTHLSKLIGQVESGEDIVIARAGVPVARLVRVTLPTTERPLGTEAGRLIIGDDFDAPLPDEIHEAFES